ncbi:hypothetical protein ACFV2H_52350 [Streptomyces sp. NPDC059629]|uniref:hypothetical protein n=1 Tax=Streptomyces sp. NPDC059629 TaxID=3346889 RepID=UPI0036A28D62
MAVQVEDALKALPDGEHREVVEVIAAALAPGSWPAPSGWDGALRQGPRAVAYSAYLDGIEAYATGWAG